MQITFRFPSHPNIAPITVEASDLCTVELATTTMESALAHMAPGSALEGFTITAIGGEDIEGSKLSEVLSASVKALSEHVETLAQLHDNHHVPVEAMQGWLKLFGRLPREAAELDGAYKGSTVDLDCFAVEDQMRQYGLDRDAPILNIVKWDAAWDGMGYGETHLVYNGDDIKYVFQRNA